MNRCTLGLAVLAFLCGAVAGQNQCVQFNGGSHGAIEVPHSDDLVPQGGLTVEGWFFCPSYPGGLIVDKNLGYQEASYILYVSDAHLGFQIRTWTAGYVFVTTLSPTLNSNQWYHLAATYDSTNVRLYLDGTLIKTQFVPGPLQNTGGDLRIGNSGTNSMDGRLDCIRIWSYARSQVELQAAAYYQLENVPGLIASWHLDGNVEDSTGNHHGTIIAPVSFVTPSSPILPFIQGPATAAIGSTLPYVINNFGGLLPYIFDISTTGTIPGTVLASGLHIPLNQPFLNFESGGLFPNTFGNFFGFLDGGGHAAPFVSIPAAPFLIGTVVNACYGTLDTNAPSGIGYLAPPMTTLIISQP